MTNPGEQQPIIDHVPGMEPFDESQLPSRAVVPIENPGPQTLRSAIGSPHAPEYGANVFGGPETTQQPASVQAEMAGESAVGSSVVLDSESPAGNTTDIIDHVPGMEPFDESQLPSRAVVPIENPGPQTLRSAIGSPHAPQYGANVHGGPTSN